MHPRLFNELLKYIKMIEFKGVIVIFIETVAYWIVDLVGDCKLKSLVNYLFSFHYKSVAK